MLIQSLRPQTFSQVVGNKLNNKILMALARNPEKGPSTIILQGSFGSGKAINSDALIPTPDGYKKASEIKEGDSLFDRKGNPTLVVGVYPQGEIDSYKVTFEDGRTVYCNKDHLWTYIDKKTNTLKTEPLSSLIGRRNKISIPVCSPVQYQEREYNIPPYIMGLLLCNSTIDKTTVLYYDPKTIPLLEEWNPNIKWDYNLQWSYQIPKDINGNIITAFTFYGSYLESIKDGRIPEPYFYGSVEQRWELLQAIMDSNATISNDNNIFCHIKNRNFVDSVLLLSYSLGLVVSYTSISGEYSLYFKSNATIKNKLFKYSRFRRTLFNSTIDPTTIAITKIEKEESTRDMVCFLVDNEEHLFLCNDFIVTHNTTTSRLFAKALNCKALKADDICNSCVNCKADLNNVPWYMEFDSSAINVDTIRDMRDIFMSTAKGYIKVVTIDETHLLSKTSQAALLKLFEETPKGLFFILATTDPDKLLPTIRSRSLELIYTAKSPKEVKEDIAKHAKDMGLTLSPATLDVIASRSKGIMRNAHMLLDKVNLIGEEEFLKSDIPTTYLLNNFLKAILKTDRVLVLDTVSELSRIPVSYLRDDWQEYFLNLMRASIDPSLIHDETMLKLVQVLGKQTQAFVKTCIQDWVIASFQNSVQAQTAMLALYQYLSREQK